MKFSVILLINEKYISVKKITIISQLPVSLGLSIQYSTSAAYEGMRKSEEKQQNIYLIMLGLVVLVVCLELD